MSDSNFMSAELLDDVWQTIPKAFEGFGGKILLVGVTYHSASKKHECIIENMQK